MVRVGTGVDATWQALLLLGVLREIRRIDCGGIEANAGPNMAVSLQQATPFHGNFPANSTASQLRTVDGVATQCP